MSLEEKLRALSDEELKLIDSLVSAYERPKFSRIVRLEPRPSARLRRDRRQKAVLFAGPRH